ncbi:hypothetical protein CYMTET_40687 [Cymbomonas tetramitiformis]|uniref:Uncharacterized protein n=1 Tax=Cymbomonas tetramitiformis TaxID=36881 RepID=A0AAE0C8V7_9CHLO|nr:hypothetical protein CYMTET_40687 [Cymbomonas tetramitiformis]
MKGAPYQSPGRKVGDEKSGNPGQQAAAAIRRVEEAAKSAVRKTAGRADVGAIPHEVTKALGDLAQQLKTFNDELPSGIQKLRELQLTEDEKTADRHQELLILLGSVVTTQKESTEALIREVQRTTSSIKTLADVLTSRYTVPIGKEHPAPAPPQEEAEAPQAGHGPITTSPVTRSNTVPSRKESKNLLTQPPIRRRRRPGAQRRKEGPRQLLHRTRDKKQKARSPER